MRLLIENGADLNKVDKWGWTPLMMASHQGYEDIVKLLVDNGADIDVADRFGKKAYDWAKTQSIFYTLTAAGMERWMKESSVLQEKH